MADVLRPKIVPPTPKDKYDPEDERQFRRIVTEAISRSTQDTIPLTIRARVTATTATTVTVRVAVADPEPQGTDSASIAHSYVIGSGAGTVDLSSPQTVTPESSLTEAANTYKDYVVTRPSVASGTGRITFTVTAANRVAATDAVDVAAVDGVYNEVFCTVTDSDDETVEITVTATSTLGTPTVHLVAINGTATLNSGPAVGATGQASGTVWVFNRGAANTGSGQVQFRATLAGAITDDDFVTIPPQGQGTVYLTMRARVTATTATTITVRVAVADPYPQGADTATITYSEVGLGASTSPSSGGTVTPAATISEAASTYIDYTVTRPTFGNGMGRITFTAAASGRISDSDSVDVTPQEVTAAGAITLSIAACIASDAGAAPPPYNQLDVPITYANLPTGTTLDVAYNNGVSGGMDSDTGIALTGSPQTVTFSSVTFAATPGFGAVTVLAKLNGQTIATAVRNKVYVT
jgi:hypothetical protein